MIKSFKDNFTKRVYLANPKTSIPDITSREATKAFYWLSVLQDMTDPWQQLNLAPGSPLEDKGNGWFVLHMPLGWMIKNLSANNLIFLGYPFILTKTFQEAGDGQIMGSIGSVLARG